MFSCCTKTKKMYSFLHFCPLVTYVILIQVILEGERKFWPDAPASCVLISSHPLWELMGHRCPGSLECREMWWYSSPLVSHGSEICSSKTPVFWENQVARSSDPGRQGQREMEVFLQIGQTLFYKCSVMIIK